MAFPSHYFGCTQERKKEKKEEELESKRQTAIKKVFFPFPQPKVVVSSSLSALADGLGCPKVPVLRDAR